MSPRLAVDTCRALAASFAALVSLAALAAAQEREPYVEHPDRPAVDQKALPDEPQHALEFAASSDALWIAYRNGFHRGAGYTSLGLLMNDDDDIALEARLLRFGEPSADTPLGLGIGLGVLGARVDVPHADVFAVTLTGAADYALDLQYPVRLGLEVSYAPGMATFADGDRVLDVLTRAEADLSSWATAFVGYRRLVIDLDDENDQKLESAFQIGVRLGF